MSAYNSNYVRTRFPDPLRVIHRLTLVAKDAPQHKAALDDAISCILTLNGLRAGVRAVLDDVEAG